ncbi:MAG: hypothetical protein F6J93_25435 [Oscillatoria sp. SIO1A7]|nr:hypothetical protein [Oscillatoria sp. SIO1A7]
MTTLVLQLVLISLVLQGQTQPVMEGPAEEPLPGLARELRGIQSSLIQNSKCLKSQSDRLRFAFMDFL